MLLVIYSTFLSPYQQLLEVCQSFSIHSCLVWNCHQPRNRNVLAVSMNIMPNYWTLYWMAWLNEWHEWSYQPYAFSPNCSNFIFPVQNKMNTHSGWWKVQKFYNLQNILIYLAVILCKLQHLNTKSLLSVLCCCVKYKLCYLCLYLVFSE
jgi:hypothetical protein